MVRILSALLLAASLGAGCSTGGGNRQATYPTPDLVQVAPTPDGKGAYVAFDVGAIREHGFVGVAKAHPVKSIMATAATGYLGYLGYKQWIKSDNKTPQTAIGDFVIGPQGAAGNFDGINGKLTATFNTEKTEGEEASQRTSTIFIIEQRP